MANTLDKIKISGTTYDIEDSRAIHSLDGYWTTGETTAAITAATSALAESIAEQGYQTSGDVQNAISGKVDTSVYTAYTAATDAVLSGKADVSDIPSVSGYADAVKYDSTSQAVKFYHGGTGGTEVYSFDASPFLIDGMVESVVITSVTSGASEVEVLQITWNSAAGGQVTNIPLTEIFDASNYYTTAQTDTKISEATSGKADTTAVTQSISEATSGKVDTSVYSAYTASTDTALSGKQDQLVSGTNIKTVGGNTLLGSGDIAWPAGLTVTVSGTTLVFS